MGVTIDNFYFGHPIYIVTKEWQKRKHRKRRINKKWLKRYGTYEVNIIPHNEIIMMDNAIWITKRTYRKLKEMGMFDHAIL